MFFKLTTKVIINLIFLMFIFSFKGSSVVSEPELLFLESQIQNEIFKPDPNQVIIPLNSRLEFTSKPSLSGCKQQYITGQVNIKTTEKMVEEEKESKASTALTPNNILVEKSIKQHIGKNNSVDSTLIPNEDLERIKSKFDNKIPVLWLFIGNSITHGAKHTYGLRSYPEIFAERIRWEMSRYTDFIINTAINGNNSQHILKGFKERVTRFQPDVVIMMIGTNDAANLPIDQFENNIKQLIIKIREINAIPILLTPMPIIIDKVSNRKEIEKYVIKIREVAEKNQVILVDNWTIWNTELQEKYQGEALTKLLDDPFHPNGLGHQELAISLFKALFIFDENSPTCNNFKYNLIN